MQTRHVSVAGCADSLPMADVFAGLAESTRFQKALLRLYEQVLPSDDCFQDNRDHGKRHGVPFPLRLPSQLLKEMPAVIPPCGR